MTSFATIPTRPGGRRLREIETEITDKIEEAVATPSAESIS
jgi:hypothetical protein